MRRSLIPLILLTLAALACALGGGAPANTSALATGVAATLTALAATPAASATTAATVAPSAPAATSTAASTAVASTAAAPTASVPTGAACPLAYTDGQTLFCLPATGAPQSLATGTGLADPLISPDGALIAYTVVITPGVSQLWVAAVAEGGEAPHLLVGQSQLPSADGSQLNSPNHVQWLAGTHTLVFDTRFVPTAGPGGPGEYINADLWTVNADTGAVTGVLPARQAGVFAASPDGHTVALARGTGLDLINADGSHRHQNVIAFPAITTYAEYTFKPVPQWSTDGSYFTVAIPSADPMAADASVAFYQVSADGTVTPRGTHPGNYVYGSPIPPQIAPDGAHVVYARVDPSGPPATSLALHMLTLQSDAMGDNVFDTQATAGGWGWSPNSQVYAYDVVPGGSGGGQLYATGPGVERPHVFADHIAGLAWLRWVNGNTVIFLGQMDGGDWALYRQTSGGEPAAVQKLVGGLNAQATFDVRP